MDEVISKISGVLYNMPKAQRRRWYVLMLMDQRGLTFSRIAGKHRMTTWTLAAAVNGKGRWTPRIFRALEAALKTDLYFLLSDGEKALLE